MAPSNRKGPLCMVAASLCWSLGGLCIKFIPWSALSIIGLRSALAAIVFAFYRKSVKVKLTRGNILAGVSLTVTITLFVFANQLTTAAAAILLQFSAPIFILLIQFAAYRQKPKISELVAVSATILGMLLFFADKLEPGGALGDILAIGSGLAFAGVTPDPTAWAFMALLGIVQVGLAYVFFSIGITRTPALLACLITALEPVLNPVWVALAIGEMPGRFAIMGGCVIVASVVGYNIWAARSPANGGGQC